MRGRALPLVLAAVATYAVTWATAPAALATHSCAEGFEILCMIPHQICLPKPC